MTLLINSIKQQGAYNQAAYLRALGFSLSAALNLILKGL
jgi:hypothetical protein